MLNDVTPTVDYIMRGGCNPDLELDDIERQIAKVAYQRFTTIPIFAEKGLKWTYNWTHFNTFWMSKDPRIQELLYRKRMYPQYIEVETTTTCNLKCTLCEHTYWDEPNVHMTLEQFKYIVDQFPDLKWIGMTGIGEAWCNPDFADMLRYIKSRNVYVELYDSFYYTDDDKAKLQVELGVEKIFVSLDGATPESYNKIRVGSNFNHVLDNVKRLDNWKKKLNSYFPELCFHFVVTKNNVHELTTYLEMIKESGIDCHMVQYTRMLHDFPEVKHLFTDVTDEQIKEVTKRSQELGIPIGWNATVPQSKPPVKECLAWFMPFIFVDGTVIPCCALNEQNDRRWQRGTCLGNIFETPFKDIWRGKPYQRMLDMLKRNKVPKNCERCSIYDCGGE